MAVSGFIQAMIVGRIVDDIAERPIDPKTWNTVALRAFQAVVFPEQK